MSDNRAQSILVVDDAPNTLEILQRNLAALGYRPFTASSVAEALGVLEMTPIDLVVTDLKMPGQSGLDLVQHVRDNFKDTEIIVITGYASIASAVEAVKLGAEEYLAKPFTDEELAGAVERTLKKLAQRRERRSPAEPAATAFPGLLGRSRVMRKVFEEITKAATSNATVLILGESGTGKELVARAIHYQGKRSAAAFVPINCAGIPEGLLESELFGHVRGAFTGAAETRAGFFQIADGGTIFLDEIGELSQAMQVKLLRVLQDRQVCMVGDTHPRRIDVRIVAATNKDLLAMVRKGAFREDLYFRVNVITIEVPPLRDREGDIPMLIDQFARKFAKEMDRPPPRFSERALDALRGYHWPGNVRELENVIQRLVVMTDGGLIDAPDLPELMRFSAMRGGGLNRSLAEIEADYITKILAGVADNKSQAAKILGIDRKTLREKMKRYGIADTKK
jgi:DNA-binding NtrC family response regulator